jgi:hypothetical protein
VQEQLSRMIAEIMPAPAAPGAIPAEITGSPIKQG